MFIKRNKVRTLVFAAMFVPSLAAADDDGWRVSWDPDSAVLEVTAGGMESLEVEITADTAQAGVKLRVSASLRPFLTVTPQDFGALTAGERRTAILTFAAPGEAAAGAITGQVRARARGDDDDDYENLPLPLPIALTVLPLPPDPGEAGKATLEGIDSDGDGLRDDVQRYIAATFPDSARARAAAAQYAKKVQETLFVGNDRVKAVNLSPELQRPRQCFYFVFGGETTDELLGAIRATDRLRAQILDTPDRSRAYLAYNALLAGGVFRVLPRSQWKKGCAFDPDALPN